MDERLDRSQPQPSRLFVVGCSVCRSPEVLTGITISNEASSLPHCDVDSPDSFKQLRLSVAAALTAKEYKAGASSLLTTTTRSEKGSS